MPLVSQATAQPTSTLACRAAPQFPAGLFEPVSAESIADLVASYASEREQLAEIAAIFDTPARRELVQHFIEGNAGDQRHGAGRLAAKLFELDGAIASLSASYWQRALALTDVLESMPQARRSEWNEQIRDHKTPEFDARTVIETLREHLNSRETYFAERVDGVFRQLSSDHVTNTPQGFRQRMILANVYGGCGVEHRKCGYINDLRIVVARFMGRDAPAYADTRRAIEAARRQRGQWLDLDGGALRIRVYKVGTAHLEIHPEMAWRLNSVLAYLHPTAIPEQHRKRPRKGKAKRAPIERVDRLLPFAVLRLIGEMACYDGRTFGPRGWYSADKHVRAEADRVLRSLGAEVVAGDYRFDYYARHVVDMVIASGSVPDKRSHQFYPTPLSLAARVVALADVCKGDRVLEPSAGQGALAVLLPEGVQCVEASALYCQILDAKGLTVHHGDFLDYKPHERFDAVAMNPPFDRGQWRAHVEHAATLLAEGGAIVAVLPASAAKADPLPGWSCTFTEPIEGAFEDTSIAVTIMVAERGICDP